jgi:SAM-dependent methyltransferase
MNNTKMSAKDVFTENNYPWVEGQFRHRAFEAFKLLPRKPRSILDLGCGYCELKQIIPDECIYTGVDIVPLVDGVMQCDLNVSFPDVADKYDVVLALGLFEHLKNSQAVMVWCHQKTDMLVTSFFCGPQPYESEGKEYSKSWDGCLTMLRSAGWIPYIIKSHHHQSIIICVHRDVDNTSLKNLFSKIGG